MTWIIAPQWSTRLSVRHDVRDGTQRIAGSFFIECVAPGGAGGPGDRSARGIGNVFTRLRLQATLGYQISLFRNAVDSLTWANPFTPVVAPGSTTGQLALAPDNQFHQIVGSVGYEINSWIRASGEFAVGRMTQDAAYLAPTLNTTLAAPPLLALPAPSLQGRADTFNGSVRVTATPMDRLRVNASYARDERDNRTDSLSYPAVSTDMFLGADATHQPAVQLHAGPLQAQRRLPRPRQPEDRASASTKTTASARLQEVVTTRETTLWGRVGVQARENVALALKLAHAERRSSTYGIATFVNPPENPLLRKFNLAERKRDVAGARADFTVGEDVNIGVNLDLAKDDYSESTIGLLDGRSVNIGGDLSVAINDQTQLQLFAQTERIRSRQAGSQAFAQPDWSAQNKDSVDVVGVGVKHQALKGKLELGADLTFSRSRSDITVDTGSASAFPTAKTSLDSLRLQATYRLQDNLSLTGSYWYEFYEAQDWRFDGVLPATISNLLAFGEQPPRYRVNVVRLALRYRF